MRRVALPGLAAAEPEVVRWPPASGDKAVVAFHCGKQAVAWGDRTLPRQCLFPRHSYSHFIMPGSFAAAPTKD